MRVTHPRADAIPGVPPAKVDVRGSKRHVADDGTFTVDEEKKGWVHVFARRYGLDATDLVVDWTPPTDKGDTDGESLDDSLDDAFDELLGEDGPLDGFDPREHTVDEIKEFLSKHRGKHRRETLRALKKVERAGKGRKTALTAIDRLVDDIKQTQED